MSDDALELVLGKLDGVRQQGGYWMARCPATSHDDTKASLSVARGTEQPVIFKCHAGCHRDDILLGLGLTLADVSTPRDERTHAEWTPRGDAIAVYDYTDEHGQLLFQVCRTADKQFPQRRPDLTARSGWRWKLGDVGRVLYRLPAVIEAVKNGETVYVVEGEKDVHSMERAGAVATTSPGGAGKWRPEYNAFFTGASVVVIADADEAGRKHAADVARQLRDVAASIRIAEPAYGKDASDHLAAGHGLEFISAEDAAGGDEAGLAGIAGKYQPVNWHEAWSAQPAEVDWLVPGFIEAGTYAVLFAKAGTGKSLIILEVAADLAARGVTVLYIDDENRLVDVVERLQDMGREPGDLDRLRLYSFAGLPALDTPAGGQALEALAVAAGARLVILDTTSRMISGRENDADTFLQMYRCSIMPLRGRGIATLRLDHPGKDASKGQRGSSAKDGDVDHIWWLEASGARGTFRLADEKGRTRHAEPAFTIRRLSRPLRHEWKAAGPGDGNSLARQLDDLGVPRDAGREKARAALHAAGVKAGTDDLRAALHARKLTFRADLTDTPGLPEPEVPAPDQDDPDSETGNRRSDLTWSGHGQAGQEPPSARQADLTGIRDVSRGQEVRSGAPDPDSVGSCARCFSPCRKYGPDASPLCETCQSLVNP
jgi:5S rRNA maturation endonuclease (ribonuclease M5)